LFYNYRQCGKEISSCWLLEILEFIWRSLVHVVICDTPFRTLIEFALDKRRVINRKAVREQESYLLSFTSCGGGWCHIESVHAQRRAECSCSHITIGLKKRIRLRTRKTQGRDRCTRRGKQSTSIYCLEFADVHVRRSHVLWRMSRDDVISRGRKAITRQSASRCTSFAITMIKEKPYEFKDLSFISRKRGTEENYVGESAFIRIGSHWVTVHEWKEWPIRNPRYLLRVPDLRLHAL